MRRFKLTSQINLIFLVVTLITGLVFVFVSEFFYNQIYYERHHEQLNGYFLRLSDLCINNDLDSLDNPRYISNYNGYIIITKDKEYVKGIGQITDIEEFLSQIRGAVTIDETVKQGDFIYNGLRILYTCSIQNDIDIIVFADNTFLDEAKGNTNTIIRVVFISLIVLGNLIVSFWNRKVISKISVLESVISNLPSQNYEKAIEIVGTDEIANLAIAVERMRQEIQKNEQTKQEMMQNISHDFKTPIAVIKSLAEAISDGISDASEADLIAKQADVLTSKAKMLLEFNKVQYLKDEKDFVMVNIRQVIEELVGLYRHNEQDINIITYLDESVFFGVSESFKIAFSNIIENALRYAKSKIVIRLQNKVLTFFNDGEPIEQKFIDHLFRPYEKGSKGQFGLGMSIVQKTIQHFNMSLKVENLSDGVMFTIEPL